MWGVCTKSLRSTKRRVIEEFTRQKIVRTHSNTPHTPHPTHPQRGKEREERERGKRGEERGRGERGEESWVSTTMSLSSCHPVTR
jgi:hypothetical protein